MQLLSEFAPVCQKSKKCEMEEFTHLPANLNQALLDLLSFVKRMTEMTEEN